MTVDEKREFIKNHCEKHFLNNPDCSGCKLGGANSCFLFATDEEICRNYDKLISLTPTEYQALAMRTNDKKCVSRVYNSCTDYFEDIDKPDPGELLNGALGLTGESGEVSDMIKKYIFHGHDLDRDELIKELGDVCWYLALLCTAIGVDMSEVMSRNIEKLKARYPEGFSESASINRTE